MNSKGLGPREYGGTYTPPLPPPPPELLAGGFGGHRMNVGSSQVVACCRLTTCGDDAVAEADNSVDVYKMVEVKCILCDLLSQYYGK